MTGLKMARIRRCTTCEHRYTRYSGLQRWPQCDAKTPHLELSDEFMEGEPSNCPRGFWLSLTAIDLDGEKSKRWEQVVAAEAKKWQSIVTALCGPIKDQAVLRSKLTPLVESDIMHADIATRLEEDSIGISTKTL